MKRRQTDFSRSLEELTGWKYGDPKSAPTQMVEIIYQAWTKPLRQLTDMEIGILVGQFDGFPFVLDLVFPKLEADPLYECGYYPGYVLSKLIRGAPDIWNERPEYQAQLSALYRRALDRPLEESDAFRESLNLPDADAASS